MFFLTSGKVRLCPPVESSIDDALESSAQGAVRETPFWFGESSLFPVLDEDRDIVAFSYAEVLRVPNDLFMVLFSEYVELERVYVDWCEEQMEEEMATH